MLLYLGFISQDLSTYKVGVQGVFIAKAALLEHELMLPHSVARSASFGRPHDAHQRVGRACSSRQIATDFMQLYHTAYAVSCRHTPMTHAYTGASCSIAARPGHGLATNDQRLRRNKLTLAPRLDNGAICTDAAHTDVPRLTHALVLYQDTSMTYSWHDYF
jgi:hypothetical protein